MRNGIAFIDLFAGIGGFRLALERVGLRCVWSCEIDKYCETVYRRNFGGGFDAKDAREIDTSTIPDFNILCAGFPCQSFSIAGKRRGFDDTRGTLFFEICRIARDKRPKILLLENVKGLLSHEKGRTFAVILLSLDDLGYDAEWQVLNSKDFGVPQSRERVFLVGHLREKGSQEIFPLRQDNTEASDLQGLQVGAITARRGNAKSDGDYVVEGNRETQTPEQAKSALIHSRGLETRKDDISHTLKGAGGGSSKNLVSLKYVGALMGSKNKKRLEDGKDLSRNFPQGQRVYSVDGLASTLASQAGGLGAKTGLYFDSLHGFGHGWQGYHNRKALKRGLIRRLTPTECERLQGFPDNWTRGVSDTQRYKMLGNAVTVNVVEAIGRRLKEVISA